MNTQVSPSTSSVKYFSTNSSTTSSVKSPLPPPSPPQVVVAVLEDTRVYSERGYDFDFKRCAFDHWDRLFASEGTGIAPPEKFFAVSRYAEVWSEVALRPVSLEPLNDVERQAIISGVFHHLARRGAPHHNQQQQQQQQQQHNAQRGSRGGSFASKRAFPPRKSFGQYQQQQQAEENEGPVLWAEESVTPLSGSIDDRGIFHTEKSTTATSNSNATVIPPGFNKEKEIEETLWYYKDPKGNEQGPFTCQIMLDWYQRKFFTDSLPLRRQKDVMFEPLGYWRVKNGGIAPFEPASVEEHQSPATPAVVSFGNFSSAPVVQEEEQLPVVIKKEPQPAVMEVVKKEVIPIGRPSSPPPPAVAPVAAKKVDVNTLFTSSTSIGRVSSKSVSSESLEVGNGSTNNAPVFSSTSSGWDNATIPITTNAGSTASNDNSTSWSNSATMSSKTTTSSNSNAGWNNIPVVSKPSLKSIIREQEQQPKQQIHATQAVVSASWKKVGEPAASAQPLSSILQEQAVTDAKNEAAAPKKAVPLTFADLVKSMSSTTIAPPPPLSTAAPKIVQRPITSSSNTVISTSSNTSSKVGVIQKPTAVIGNPLKEWCMSELSPLKAHLDLSTVVTLLLENKSASEAAAFIRDNLDTSKFDLVTFGREFVKRKFNKDMPTYAFIHQPTADEDEEQPFEEVQRRRK